MKPLRSREDLIELISSRALSRACLTAISEGRSTVLGGFAVPECLPCYIVKVTSKHKKDWYVRVSVDEGERKYLVSIIDVSAVPWRGWQGATSTKRWNIMSGDTPDRVAAERSKCCQVKHQNV